MQTESDGGSSLRFPPGLTRIFAIGWVGGLGLIYLIQYDGALLPLACFRLAVACLPALRMGPFFGQFLLQSLIGFGFLAVLLATAFAMGAVAIRKLALRDDPLEALFAVAVGFWLMATGTLLLGAVSVTAVRWVFAGGLCWLMPSPRRLLREAWSGVKNRREPLDSWSKLALVFIVVAAFVTLPGVLVPPFEYDELEYHLGALTEYQRAGHIAFLPHNFYSNMPQLTEMLYLLAVTTASDVAAKLVHWMFGWLAAIGVCLVGTRLWTRRVGLTAAMLFYCSPMIQDLSQSARIDLATTFFAALAFGGLLLWMDQDSDRGRNVAPTNHSQLWLSAMAAGCAMATKWTAIPVVLVPAILIVAVAARSMRLLSIFCLWSSVFVLPWLLKNWSFAGNPVYPLFNGFFHSPYWSADQAALFARVHYGVFGRESWSQLGGLLWQYCMTDPLAVPVLLMTVPLILLLKKPIPSAARAAWLFLAAYAGWFFLTYRPGRFMVPALSLAALSGACAWHALERGRWIRIMIRAVVALVVAASISSMVAVSLVDAEDKNQLPPRMNFVQFALGQVSRAEFIGRVGGGMYEPILWMNRSLPATARILFLGEVRPYYARQAVLWSTMFDQAPLGLLMRQAHDDRSLLEALRSLRVTHIYVNGYELARLRRSYGYLADIDGPRLNQFLSTHARPVHERGPCTVYELKDAS